MEISRMLKQGTLKYQSAVKVLAVNDKHCIEIFSFFSILLQMLNEHID